MIDFHFEVGKRRGDSGLKVCRYYMNVYGCRLGSGRLFEFIRPDSLS